MTGSGAAYQEGGEPGVLTEVSVRQGKDKGFLPIGGRLQHFAETWESSISDAWVLETIRFGLKLEFSATPPNQFLVCPRSADLKKRQLMNLAINHLLEIAAIQPVAPEFQGRGFYSQLFVLPKSSGGWRAILDLKRLNRFIKYRKFKMHTLQSILVSVRQGDFLASIDLTEAYLHIPIRPSHFKFLRFCYEGRHFEYRAMPFGLSSAPRAFTKILAALTAHIRQTPIRIQCYLDDILILSSSAHQARANIRTTIQVLQAHGFSINTKKSQLSPSTRLSHLGSIIDTSQNKVFLSPDRLNSISNMITSIRPLRKVPLRDLSSLLGKMVSCIAIVPWARFHSRSLQGFLLPYQRSGCSDSSVAVSIPPRVRTSLLWWQSSNMHKGSPLKEPHRRVITTDASLYGWGAHCQHLSTQGRWSQAESTKSINWLELRAVTLALHFFASEIQGQNILILTDNVTTKAHINRQGGTHSITLMQEAHRLCQWSEKNLASIRAEHISGVDNVQADWLSRTTVDQGEWKLHPQVFRELSQKFDTPRIDMFASHLNTQLPRFVSRFPAPGAENVNALRCRWPHELLYAFPPLPIIPQVIRRILEEEAEVILVAPFWPRRPWFADLMELSVQPPWRVPDSKVSLSQGPLKHPDPTRLQLAGWRLSGKGFRNKNYQGES
uniref:ribonuclease H n=1 Tax=Micrurus lemniscatus lemniscatus TaxID=129467 RepID=A0A2D4J0A8_MICLE